MTQAATISDAGPLGLAALRRSFAGQLLLPGADDFEAARRVWNAMVDRQPAIIARCASPADVAAAVRFAAKRGLEVGVRGGGHSVLGVSVPAGGLLVDLSLLQAVRVDPDRRRAWVQGGDGRDAWGSAGLRAWMKPWRRCRLLTAGSKQHASMTP